jgi:nucleoside-diphosphate-sugar epimerase
MSTKKKVLITGAAGRIGRLLSKSLKNRYTIRAVDIVPGEGDFEFIQTDITDFASTKKIIEGVDAIIHLAAIIPPQSEFDRKKTMRVNVEGTRNLLKAIRREEEKVPFIFTSSVAIYDTTENSGHPITVNHKLGITDIYSESKIISEDLVRNSKVPYTILRVSGVYAPDRIELPETLQFQKDQKVEFVYVDDVVTALRASIDTEKARNKIFNIAGGKSWRMTGQEFIERMYGVLNLKVEPNYSPYRTYFSWYDTEISNRILGYQQTSFSDFLEKVKDMGKKLGFL